MSWEEDLISLKQQVRDAAFECLEREDGYVGPQAEDSITFKVNMEFDIFGPGHWKSCEHMSDKLLEAARAMTLHKDDHLARAVAALADWTDPAGDVVNGYVGASATAVTWRLDYIQAMQGIAGLHEELIKCARQDVRKVASATIAKLKERDSLSLSEAFAIAGAVTSIVLMLNSPLAVAGVIGVFTVADRVKSVFESSGTIIENLHGTDISGGDTFEILESAYENLHKIRDGLMQQEEELVVGGLKEIVSFANDYTATLSPVAPEAQNYDDAQLRAIDPEKLRNAGELLPVIADDNRTAAMHVASILENEPHAFEAAFLPTQQDIWNRPARRWEARRQALQNMFTATADELDILAGKLILVADGQVALQDAQTQEILNIMGQIEGVDPYRPVPTQSPAQDEPTSRISEALG